MSKFWAGLCICAAACAQTIEGDWQGTLDVGVKLRLGLHIRRDAGGGFTSKLDSIDQGAMGLPVSSTKITGDRLHLDMPSLHATFEGKWSGNEIAGTFTQGTPLPLTFKRVAKTETLNRPQNPKPPFPYDAIDVAYENHDIKLAGTLTVSRGNGPFAAALLITGSGPQDRDETLLGHKPFWIIADYLTRRGIAVLRVDDRGVGKSGGESTMTTVDEMAGDVIAGVEFLKTRKEIDAKRIGVIGHSEGGIVGPAAAARSQDISFVVLLAGTGVTGEQVLYLQAELAMRAAGANEAAIAQNRKIQDLIFRVLREERDEKDRGVVLAKLREAWKSEGHPPGGAIDAEFARVTAPELRSFILLDPAEALRKVKAPVLAMNGSRDVQVSPQQNLPAILAALTAGGNPDVTAVELPGLNHLFQKCVKCSVLEYGDLEESFSPDALELMGDWLARHTRGQ